MKEKDNFKLLVPLIDGTIHYQNFALIVVSCKKKWNKNRQRNKVYFSWYQY